MSAFGFLASLPEDHFVCTICLNVFSDPVTTPCGHNFCRTCLSQHWDRSELCHCPTCSKRFYVRPEFSTNTVIAEISGQIKKRKVEILEDVDAPGKVKCDVCTDLKFKALKSCLGCQMSYCEAHLEPHQRVPSLMRHELIEPVENLEERMCRKHERIMECSCRDDQVCICLLCSETDHKTVPVKEEGAQQRENIESQKAKVKLMIEERMEKMKEFTECSELRKIKADQEIEESNTLFSNLINKVEEMQTTLQSNIQIKLRTSQEKDEAVIQELHDEIAELERKHSELDELSQNEDHPWLLQTLKALSNISASKDWSKIKVYSDLGVQTARKTMADLVHTFKTELKTLTKAELTTMRQYKESVTFNPSTVGEGLVVTESGKRLKYSRAASLSSDSGRFGCPMAFGTEGFTSGRHYWEVQVALTNGWDVGVAKETVNRSGKVFLKRENGFFAIGKRFLDYKVHSTPYIVLYLCPRPRLIGVYLDYEEGRVSFFDVNENLHIYSFTGESFTEKLFPYFYLLGTSKKSEPLLIKD